MIDRNEALRKLAMNVARYSGVAPLAKPLMGGVGAILMLHHVSVDAPKPLGMNAHLTITPYFLDEVITLMKRMGYEFVGMDEAVERIAEPVSGSRFAAITADDAYRDNLAEALPVLETHDAPITVYAAPGLVDGSVDVWWELLEDVVTKADQVHMRLNGETIVFDCATPAARRDSFVRILRHLSEDFPEEEQRDAVREMARQAGLDPCFAGRSNVMDWDQLRRMARHRLVTIGAHTVHHYNLKRLGEDRALAEMSDAATRIADETGKRPRHMAFPYGFPSAVGQREVDLAEKAGFASAVTTRHGLIRAEHARHLCALPRISLNGRYQDIGYVRTMLSGVTTPLANAGRRLVTV
ncbi:MAG: polysaccharide deacetylase [Rhizobiales bacterium 65-79]|jgi:peptidoglycan/xylan/chitin deacetylase (PgdA/CDA1 family)|nr:MAG: polysaccharide deacetylase [Rhizobiales bacterium 65-79]